MHHLKLRTSHLVRNMAFDLGEKNIRVNGIAPGAILTDALKSVITPEIEQKNVTAHADQTSGPTARYC